MCSFPRTALPGAGEEVLGRPPQRAALACRGRRDPLVQVHTVLLSEPALPPP